MGERPSPVVGVRGGWLRRLIERVLESPLLYDLIQAAAGERQLRRRLGAHLRALPADGRLIDIGGGTGLSRQAAAVGRYVCMDLDFAKLRRFHGGGRGRLAVLADATSCPFETGKVDGILCAKVLHHLDDRSLQFMLAESVRILKPEGVLILADAVRTTRWTSRMLWRFDRGSHPRTSAEIRRSLPAHYAVTAWEEFHLAACHDFVLCAARKTRGERGEQRPGAREWPTN